MRSPWGKDHIVGGGGGYFIPRCSEPRRTLRRKGERQNSNQKGGNDASRKDWSAEIRKLGMEYRGGMAR